MLRPKKSLQSCKVLAINLQNIRGLTLALASTLAPFLSRIRMMSVWLARAARWRGVSPRTVASSGLAW